MRSNTPYIIMGIVVLHFLVGIIWLIVKMNQKKK